MKHPNLKHPLHFCANPCKLNVNVTETLETKLLKYRENGDLDMVNNFLEGMSQQGWTQQSSSKLPIGTITNFTKSDRKCTISIGPPKDELIKVAIIY